MADEEEDVEAESTSPTTATKRSEAGEDQESKQIDTKVQKKKASVTTDKKVEPASA